MSYKLNNCIKCGTSESPSWTNAESLGLVCLSCVNEAKEEVKSDDDEEKDENKRKRRTRASRSYKTRHNPLALPPKPTAPRGRGRRVLFKKTPMKAPSSVATTVTRDQLFHKARN